MRKLLIAIVIVGGLASIALCGSFGWDQATETKDRVTQAFIYGFVAMATLAMHGLAMRMWVNGWRKSGAFVGIVGVLAFMMTAFTSLGGLASRSDKVIAERQDVLDTKADTKGQIDGLVAEKAGLKFTRTTKAGIDAAQRAVEAAKLAKDRECGDGTPKQRGPFCRQKEDAEAAALAAFGKAQDNKAITDRVIEIDAELKRLRELKTDGTVGSANPLEALLSKILGTWASMLTAWQKAVFAVIYDLVLVALMIGIEVLGHASSPPKKQQASDTEIDAVVDVTPIVISAPREIEERDPVAEPAVALPPKPRLVAKEKSTTAGVAVFLAERLQPKQGARVELEDCQNAYIASGLRPLTAEQFVESLQHFCRACRVKTKIIGDKVYLMNVELVDSKPAADGTTERAGAQRLGRMGKAKRATEPA